MAPCQSYVVLDPPGSVSLAADHELLVGLNRAPRRGSRCDLQQQLLAPRHASRRVQAAVPFVAEVQSVSQTELPVDDAHAAVHHDPHATGVRDPGGFVGAEPQLQPQTACTDRDGVLCDRGRLLGRAKDLHDVDLAIDLAQRRKTTLAEQLVLSRVDGDHRVSVRAHVPGDVVGRAQRIRRAADHGDRGGIPVQAA